jgi:hypothetical protein
MNALGLTGLVTFRVVGNPEGIPRMFDRTSIAAAKQFTNGLLLALFCRAMREDSSAPYRGAGGSRCNAEVWQ